MLPRENIDCDAILNLAGERVTAVNSAEATALAHNLAGSAVLILLTLLSCQSASHRGRNCPTQNRPEAQD